MRNVVALSIGLVAALVAAYVVWTDDSEEVSDASVAVFDAREADVTKVAYHTEKVDVVVERRSDKLGEYFWVDATERKTKPKKNPHDPHEKAKADDEKGDKAKGDKAKGDKAKNKAKAEEETPEEAPAPEPEVPDEVKVEQSSFLASDAAEDLWKSVAPLLAMRELQAPADPSVFGLDAPSGTLEVTRGSGVVKLELGGETYGAKDRYVRYDGKVFLVDDAKLKPLDAATGRLMERALFPSEQKQIDRIELVAPNGKVAWNQVNRDDAAKAAWARPETPEVSDEVGATWLTKLLGLKLDEYVAGDPPTSLEPVFAYHVVAGREQWDVQVLRTTSEPWSFYARSAYNRSLVKLVESAARGVADDVDGLVQPTAP